MNKRLSDAQPVDSKIQEDLLNAELIVAIREIKAKMEASAEQRNVCHKGKARLGLT